MPQLHALSESSVLITMLFMVFKGDDSRNFSRTSDMRNKSVGLVSQRCVWGLKCQG
jgi:hypothetical protein